MRVALIGAGLMGAQIAAEYALGGHDVQPRHLVAGFQNMVSGNQAPLVYLGSQFFTANPTPTVAAIQERLRALREIEAERAKPRVVVRQVSVISGITLAAFVLLSPGFFAPYGTPLGQVILAILLALYVLAVWTMRRMTLARSRERILRSLT